MRISDWSSDVCSSDLIIVFANEKGGTGKSTTAVHVAIALAAKGARVAAFDLDHRQRTTGRYLDNRAATVRRTGRALPMPIHETHDGVSEDRFEEVYARLAGAADYLVIDTPGRADPFARLSATRASGRASCRERGCPDG